MKLSSCLFGAGFLALLSSTAFAEQTLIRVATMPSGAEVTGLSTNAEGSLFLNAQHPGGKDELKEDGVPAFVGYVHGFDTANTASVDVSGGGDGSAVSVANGEYVTFGRAGDDLGSGEKLGGVYGSDGALLYISNAPDFNGFVPVSDGKAWLYTAWEGAGREGMGAVSKIALNKTDGKWTADLAASRMVDLRGIAGGQVLCSGTVTPWGNATSC